MKKIIKLFWILKIPRNSEWKIGSAVRIAQCMEIWEWTMWNNFIGMFLFFCLFCNKVKEKKKSTQYCQFEWFRVYEKLYRELIITLYSFPLMKGNKNLDVLLIFLKSTKYSIIVSRGHSASWPIRYKCPLDISFTLCPPLQQGKREEN